MHKNNEKGQKQIHFMMEQLDLVDSFRELNPDIKRYAWRGPAKKQARLDLFLFSSHLQLFIHESNIGIAYTACPFTYCSTCCTYNKNHARIIERTLRACT